MEDFEKEIKKQTHLRKGRIHDSLSTTGEILLEKAVPIGTRKNYGGSIYVKVSQGKGQWKDWQLVPKKKLEPKEKEKKPELKEEKVKDKTGLDKAQEDWNDLDRERKLIRKRIEESMKGYQWAKEPWKKRTFKKAANQIEAVNRKINALEYNHTDIKKVLREFDIGASTERTTGIRGFTRQSIGYELNREFDAGVIRFYGKYDLDAIKTKLEEIGFKIIDSSSSSITVEKYYKDLDKPTSE